MKIHAFLRYISIIVLASVCAVAISQTGGADEDNKDDIPIYKQEPHDRIYLDKANESKILDVDPLGLTRKEIERNMKSRKVLTFTPYDKPDKTIEIPWRNVVKVETFGELILNKAKELCSEDKFDEAFDYFTFLQQNMPEMSGVSDAFDQALQQEVMKAYDNGKFDDALALLRELHRRNPEFTKLENAMGRMTDKLVEKYAEKNDYRSARILLNALAKDYPQNAHVARWRERFQAEAAPMLAEARAAADAGRWRKVAELSRKITNVCPAMPGARELALQVNRKYPQIIVGVGSLASDFTPGRLVDWSARRDSRLLYRTLAEFAGPGIEGGSYVCPVGSITPKNLGRQISIVLNPNIHWATGPATLSNTDVSVRLLEMATPGNPLYRLDWADLVGSVSTSGVYKVDVDLLRAHVRPEAMLQIVLAPLNYDPSSGPPPTNGPMVVSAEAKKERIFAANERYFAAEEGQPMEIVERRYGKVAQAIRALKRGDIDMIDRLNPWMLSELRDEEGIIVQPYALPLVHCLVPNMNRPLMRDRTFRRALAYGIKREAIVEQMLKGETIPGCVATSSPFPLSTGPNDPMGYASDERIRPRPYEPRLSIALASVAWTLYNKALEAKKAGKDKKTTPAEKPAAEEKPDANENPDAEKKSDTDEKANAIRPSPLKDLPPIVLAHPADEIASGACRSIQLQLKLVGLEVKLKPITGPMPDRVPDDVDLMYVELATWEPVVDARRLLGEDGMAGDCSPFMSQALRRLDEAVEWGEVRTCLHQIHAICYADAAVIPLWQIVDHFAYNDRIQQVSFGPVSLFQNLEQWRLAFEYPSEQ